MDRRPGLAHAAETKRLLIALERLLGRAMGVNVPLFGRLARLAPLPFASLGFAAYVVLAAAAIALAERLEMPSDPRFTGLILWGMGWYATVLFLSRMATLRAIDIVRRDILPYAPPEYIAAVADDLERRRSPLMQWAVPLAAAFVAMVASGIALSYETPDIGPFNRFPPERTFWSLAAFYLCFLAARGVLVGRFYEPFARRLAEAESSFYVLGAADSPLVRGVASLGQQMVVFWAMIFLAILSIMVLAFERLAPFAFGSGSPFLLFVVPTAGFASLGYGSLVYLRSESAIRTALQRFAAARAEALQRRCNDVLDPAAGRFPEKPDDVERMSAWHDKILAGASYGNRIATMLSYTLPFVMPLLSLAQTLLG